MPPWIIPELAPEAPQAEVLLLEQEHRQPAHGAVARHARAVHAAPEDDDVVGPIANRHRHGRGRYFPWSTVLFT